MNAPLLKEELFDNFDFKVPYFQKRVQFLSALLTILVKAMLKYILFSAQKCNVEFE